MVIKTFQDIVDRQKNIEKLEEMKEYIEKKIQKLKKEEIKEQKNREVIRSITYQLERVKCGKPGCKKCSNGTGHGPYWYAYWRENGRVKSKYIGKELKNLKY